MPIQNVESKTKPFDNRLDRPMAEHTQSCLGWKAPSELQGTSVKRLGGHLSRRADLSWVADGLRVGAALISIFSLLADYVLEGMWLSASLITFEQMRTSRNHCYTVVHINAPHLPDQTVSDSTLSGLIWEAELLSSATLLSHSLYITICHPRTYKLNPHLSSLQSSCEVIITAHHSTVIKLAACLGCMK